MSEHLSSAGREMKCEEESRVTWKSREREEGCIQASLEHFAKFAKNTPSS